MSSRRFHGGSSWCACRLVALAVIKDGILAVAEFTFLEDALVQLLQVIFCETIVLQEFLNFVINILGETRSLITVLDLELVDQESLELLTLLDVEKALAAGLAHLRSCRRGTVLLLRCHILLTVWIILFMKIE